MQPKYLIELVKISKQSLPGMLAGLAILVAGCAEPPPPPAAPKPFQDITLRVAVPNVNKVRELMERHGRIWADRAGARLELVAADAKADVRIFAPAEMGRLVAGGELAALSLASQKGEGSFEYNRLLRFEVERSMDWGGQTYGLPVLGEAIVCVYRSDLLDDTKHSAELDKRFRDTLRHPYHAGGPFTWQEFALIAEYFAGRPGWDGSAGGVKQSLPPLPSSPEELERDFHLISSSFARRAVNHEKVSTLSAQEKTDLLFSYQFDVESGRPLIDGPGFVEAFKLMQRLQAFRPAGTSSRPLDAFRTGHAVLAIATLADIHGLQEESSPVHDRFAICRMPGSDLVYDHASNKMQVYTSSAGNFVPYHGHGGWMAGRAAKAAQPEAANDLLIFLSSPPISQEIICETAWGGGPTRSTHLDNRAPWFNYGLSHSRTLQLIAALDGYYRPSLLNPTYRLRLPDQDEYLRILTKRIETALEMNQPAEAALKDVAQGWRALANDKNKSTHLHDYRMSQGLR